MLPLNSHRYAQSFLANDLRLNWDIVSIFMRAIALLCFKHWIFHQTNGPVLFYFRPFFNEYIHRIFTYLIIWPPSESDKFIKKFSAAGGIKGSEICIVFVKYISSCFGSLGFHTTLLAAHQGWASGPPLDPLSIMPRVTK